MPLMPKTRRQSGQGANPDELSGGTFILTGPAGCGKTTAAVELYERHLDEAGRPGCLLIVPNLAAVGQMRERLLGRSAGGVVVAPAVTTFASLAAGVLAGAGQPAGRLSAVGRHLLLTRIIAEMAAEGAFKALGPLADAPGLVDALDASIAELKRAAIDPEELAGVIDRRRGKDADLLEVYRRYQQSLHETRRYDVEGQMWQGRDVLAADPAAGLGYDRVEAVAADGFTDFTPTQAQILALLAGRVQTMLITLPVADQPARRRMWFWTRRTLERLREALPEARVIEADPAGDPFGGLFDLSAEAGETANDECRSDFAGGSSDKISKCVPSGRDPLAVSRRPTEAGGGTESGSAKDAPALTIIAAADPDAEVRAVARSVKADLLAGAKSVAVIARGLEGYAEPARRVFAECGIPLPAAPGPLAESPVIRYVLSLLSIWPEAEFHDVAGVLRSSYFRPSALGEGFDRQTAVRAEMALRTANVLGGPEAYAAAFERLGRRAQMAAASEGDEDTIELGPLAVEAGAVAQAGALVEALLGRLDVQAGCRGAEAFVAAVRGLIEGLEVPQAAESARDEEVVAADLRALAAFEVLLEEVASSGAGASADASEMVRIVTRAAVVARLPAARTASPVALLDVMDARPLRFDRVYLLGLNEKAFPRLVQERCFIDESDRAAWGARGVVLDRRSDLVGREMLLMYLACTRAEGGLTVSYLTADATGKPLAPSVFLDELESAARRGGMAVEHKTVAPGRFVPPAGEIATAGEVANAAVLAAFDGSRRTMKELAAGAPELLAAARRWAPGALEAASHGILASHRRWREEVPDAFDGRIDDPALLAALAERFPGHWVFSASELNSYARCPWQFFGRYLLGLRPLAAPEVQMTPTDRGSFCHDVLWRTFTSLRERFGAPVVLAEIDAEDVEEALGQAVEAERRRLAEVAEHSGLWEVQTRYWRSMLREYLAAERDRAEGGAVYFELGFGMGGAGAERMDPASLGDPVTVRAGEWSIRARGKIDRVDRLEGLLAVDYKTGAVPSGKSMNEGLDVQLAVYGAVLAEAFGGRVHGGAYHDVRRCSHKYFADFKRTRTRRVDVEDFAGLLAASMRAVGGYVEGMRSGRFDALPRHGCASWCPYRQICHYSRHRAEIKAAAVDEEAGGPGDG